MIETTCTYEINEIKHHLPSALTLIDLHIQNRYYIISLCVHAIHVTSNYTHLNTGQHVLHISIIKQHMEHY